MQSGIHVCFGLRRAELLQWLQSHYDIATSLPQTSYKICLVDSQSLDRAASRIRKLKQSNPRLYMPLVLISDREDLGRMAGILDDILDEVVLEPVTVNELKVRINALLKAHEFSARAQNLEHNETKLQLQAQRLANLSENVPGMIFQFAVLRDGTKKFEYISNGIRDIFGIEPEEGMKDPMLIIGSVHPEEINLFQERLNYAILNHQPFFWQGRYTINGKLKWLRSASTPHDTDYGVTWDGVIVDITALKEAEDRVRDLARFNEQIIENTREGIIVFDKELHITRWNRSMEEISGLARERVVGLLPQEVFPFLKTKGAIRQFEQALDGKRVKTEDYWYVFAESGARGWAVNTVVPFRDASGEIIGVLCAISEITERKNYEQELKAALADLKRRNEELSMINAELDTAYDRLQKIDRAKTEFVSTASHEIRTPLASILGFVQTILSPDIELSDKKQKEYLQVIESETKRLNQLVDTMLNISRLDAGKQQLQLGRFALSDLVRAIKDTISLESTRHIFVNVIDKDPGLVRADKQQINLVIRNILNNAIRYTGEGGKIDITIEKKPGEV
ncbi:MAG: PAS domain-containing sensor histidine kinase, partial [Chitinispirillaceae bacterium]